jgi:hypothetical protein
VSPYWVSGINIEENMSDNLEYDQEAAIAEFLAKGGVIQQIPRGVGSEQATTNFWGTPKKKSKEKPAETDPE